MHRTLTGLITGPVLFVLFLAAPVPEGMTPEAQKVAAIAILMAVWWITEAIPIPATALLPIALYPIMGVMSGADVTHSYAHHLIFLFMGGFLIAVTMQKWNLHRRIALETIRMVGMTPERIVLGFMLATAFLSMWISNTAATMLMVTIGMAVIRQASGETTHTGSPQGDDYRFGTALMLGIGYSASIGGIATLVGTPPNAILVGVLEDNYGQSISFMDWMLFGVPLSLLMLFITWWYLTRLASRCSGAALSGSQETLRGELNRLGPMSRPEKLVAGVFILVAALWILRGLLKPPGLEMVRDSTIAIAGALLLFVIPADWKKREFLLDWQTAVRIPWDIIILFGGGFALARGFSTSGLTAYLAGQLALLEGASVVVIIATVALLVTFLTEVTSNTATATLLLPVMGALSEAMHVHPYGLMITAVIAASFAFMLPVATPPNAIVFSARYVSISRMARIGLFLNLIGVVLITAFATLWLPRVWGLDLTP